MSDKISVLVPIHNPNLSYLVKMLMSMKDYTPELGQVLVFDNASEKGEEIEKLVRDIFKDKDIRIDYIHNKENIGVGRAYNRLLPLVQHEFMATLNDDIEVFEVWSTPMLKLLEEDPRIAQVTPKYGICNSWDANGHGCPIETDEPEYAEGSLAMTRTSLMRKYGGYDDCYLFGYYEDADLSLRFRRDGYKIRNVNIKWVHHRATTSSKVKEDVAGYHILNEHTFKERWNAYLIAKRFGRTIVFLRGASIGDVFLLTPIIERWKELYPDDVIVVQTQNPQAIMNHPMIDLIYPYKMPIACTQLIDFDYAYEKDFRTSIVDSYAKISGIMPRKRTGTVYASEEDISFVQKLVRDRDMQNTVALELSGTWPAKKWDDKNYAQLMELLKKQGYKTVGIGKRTNKEFPYPLDMNFINMLTPIQTALMMNECNAFIGHEGLLAHFAQALDIPAVVLYGCTKPECTNDLSKPALFKPVRGHVACQGCRHRYNAGTAIHCTRNYQCMKSITVEEVLEQFQLLDLKRPVRKVITSKCNTTISNTHKMKVFMAAGDMKGSGALRIFTPAIYLEQRCNGIKVVVDTKMNNSFIQQSDIVVLQRPVGKAVLPFAKSLKMYGKKIVTELDDDVWNIPPDNPVRKVYNRDALNILEQVIALSDAVTVSTEPIVEIIKKFNKNIHVFPNSIEFDSFFDDPREPHDKVRIGWAGSHSHQADLAIIHPVLMEIARKYQDRVQLVFMGMMPDAFIGIAEHYPFVPYQLYMGELQRLNLDIGVLPLVNNAFNKSKSPLKFLDYSALHIPCIASPVYPYSTTIKHGETGVVVKNNNSKNWVEAISYLIEDEKMRKELADNANRYVKEHFDIQKNVGLWFELYKTLKETQ